MVYGGAHHAGLDLEGGVLDGDDFCVSDMEDAVFGFGSDFEVFLELKIGTAIPARGERGAVGVIEQLKLAVQDEGVLKILRRVPEHAGVARVGDVGVGKDPEPLIIRRVDHCLDGLEAIAEDEEARGGKGLGLLGGRVP